MKTEQLSSFSQLAGLLTVGDICSPMLEPFDGGLSLAAAYEEWTDRSIEIGFSDPDEIALVEVEGRVRGWIGMETFDADAMAAGKSLSECVDAISPSAILTADTSVLEALKAFAQPQPWFYFVMRGSRFVGWLTYNDFYKLPFRLCLFALLLSIEKLALDALRQSPDLAVRLLESNQRATARGIYKKCGYRLRDDAQEHPHLLLDCTSFTAKVRAIQRWEAVSRKVTALADDSMLTACENLRNSIAHGADDTRFSELLDRRTLVPFVSWAERLEAELHQVQVTGEGAD